MNPRQEQSNQRRIVRPRWFDGREILRLDWYAWYTAADLECPLEYSLQAAGDRLKPGLQQPAVA